MDIIKELEAVRKRIIQEINTEFDLLIERAISEGMTVCEPVPDEAYQSIYPLTAGAKIFKGMKPTNVIFENGARVHVSTWKQVVHEIMKECIKSEKNKQKLCELRGNVSGRKRLLLAEKPENMRSPLMLCDNLYMETHYDTETLLNVLTLRILGAIQYNYTNIKIAIRNH